MDRIDFMNACRHGGQHVNAALRAMYRDYSAALVRDGWLMLRDADAAQDLLQDTLIKAWQRCASFRGESELFPWLRQVLRHGAIERLRRQRPMESMDEATDRAAILRVEAALLAFRGAPAGPEQALGERQQGALYRRCAERFAAEQPLAAQVIRWIVEDELDATQVADLLQRNAGATREFISQCRKKARVYFHDWYLHTATRLGQEPPLRPEPSACAPQQPGLSTGLKRT